MLNTVNILLLTTLALWPFGGGDKIPNKSDGGLLAQTYVNQYVLPKVDLPRGTYKIFDGDIDFADIEQRVEAYGNGLMQNTPARIKSAEGHSNKVVLIVGQLNRTDRDPRSIKLIFKNKRRSMDLADPEVIHSLLDLLFELNVDQARVAALEAKPDYRIQQYTAPPPVSAGTAPATYAPAPLAYIAAPPIATAPQTPDALGDVRPGAAKKEVFAILGDPRDRETRFEGDVVVELWFYEWADKSSTLVTYRDGIVSAVKNF